MTDTPNDLASDRHSGRVLCVGRSDSLGASGIQGDIKTVTGLGGYAAGVVTIVTAGDAESRYVMAEVSPTVVVGQIEVVAQRIGIDAIKIGLLLSQEQVDLVAATLESVAPKAPRILSPALLDEAGRPILTHRAIAAWKRRLIVDGTIVVTATRDAEVLTGMEIRDEDSMAHAAEMMMTFGCQAALLHGGGFRCGHGIDMFASDAGTVTFEDGIPDARKINGLNSAYGAAIATLIAQDRPVRDAIDSARSYVEAAVARTLPMRDGERCLDHARVMAAGSRIE